MEDVSLRKAKGAQEYRES